MAVNFFPWKDSKTNFQKMMPWIQAGFNAAFSFIPAAALVIKTAQVVVESTKEFAGAGLQVLSTVNSAQQPSYVPKYLFIIGIAYWLKVQWLLRCNARTTRQISGAQLERFSSGFGSLVPSLVHWQPRRFWQKYPVRTFQCGSRVDSDILSGAIWQVENLQQQMASRNPQCQIFIQPCNSQSSLMNSGSKLDDILDLLNPVLRYW